MSDGMKERDWKQTRCDVHPHDHAVLVYDREDDLLAPLETFLHEGVKGGEASTFVHSFPGHREATAFVARGVDDVDGFEARKDLNMAFYREAFERNGRIDPKHVEGVVGMLAEAAQSNGRKRVRVFVDASRNYFEAGRVDEWFAFESWLGPRLAADMGLVCAYRATDLADPAILARVLATHAYRFGLPARRGHR
jgi:hypothetical protein